MTVEILQEAEDEPNAAVAYYEDIEAGLGIRLKEEARAAIHWVGRNPEVPRLREKGQRDVHLAVNARVVQFCGKQRLVID